MLTDYSIAQANKVRTMVAVGQGKKGWVQERFKSGLNRSGELVKL